MSLISKNLLTTAEPNVYPAPLQRRSLIFSDYRHKKGMRLPRRNGKVFLIMIRI